MFAGWVACLYVANRVEDEIRKYIFGKMMGGTKRNFSDYV